MGVRAACDGPSSLARLRTMAADGEPRVVDAFGKTGGGPGEFLYPEGHRPRRRRLGSRRGQDRPDSASDSRRGNASAVIRMPLIDAGKPTGISVHKDGRLFVADTHYHRVRSSRTTASSSASSASTARRAAASSIPPMSPSAPDGRIFVSEYGGNDRISIFTAEGDFLSVLRLARRRRRDNSRSPRPCASTKRGDASTWRMRAITASPCIISTASLTGYFGAAGRGPGQLRYPYGLSLLPDGTIVVCEYGNNRIQLFSPQGESLAVYGQAGRELGQLAYPWGVAVDSHRRAYRGRRRQQSDSGVATVNAARYGFYLGQPWWLAGWAW